MTGLRVLKHKIDSKEVLRLNTNVKNLSKVLTDLTPKNVGYAFYRGRIFSTDVDGVIGLNLLASNEDGNFLVINLEYDTTDKSVENGVIYYPEKIALFEKEEPIKEAILTLVKSFSFGFEVSQLYFDFILPEFESKLAAVYSVEDVMDKDGGRIVYASAGSGFHYQFCLSEAGKLCYGTSLSCNWVDILKIVSELTRTITELGSNLSIVDNSIKGGIQNKISYLKQYGIIYSKKDLFA